MDMITPDYVGGSIANLMSTLARKYGGRTPYPELRTLKSTEIATKKTILLVIDGLGYEWLLRHGPKSFLARNLRASMTSVFPATTAAAMTAVYTGVPAQQHGLTGWFVYFRELGMVTAPLLARARGAKASIARADYSQLIPERSFFTKIKTKGAFVCPREYIVSPYNARVSEGAALFPYTGTSLQGMLRATVRANRRHAYVNAYWQWHDDNCHAYGVAHKKTITHFRELDRAIERFAKRLKGTTLIITADHGLVDVQHVLFLNRHPRLQEMLALPLAGDYRTAYCYVRGGREKEFERYVRTKFASYCVLHRSEELVKRGFFGNGRPRRQLREHVGDYTLLCKEGCGVYDQVLGEQRHLFPGHHSGMTREEMVVPLILFTSK